MMTMINLFAVFAFTLHRLFEFYCFPILIHTKYNAIFSTFASALLLFMTIVNSVCIPNLHRSTYNDRKNKQYMNESANRVAAHDKRHYCDSCIKKEHALVVAIVLYSRNCAITAVDRSGVDLMLHTLIIQRKVDLGMIL